MPFPILPPGEQVPCICAFLTDEKHGTQERPRDLTKRTGLVGGRAGNMNPTSPFFSLTQFLARGIFAAATLVSFGKVWRHISLTKIEGMLLASNG
jgi:hypothetical protein